MRPWPGCGPSCWPSWLPSPSLEPVSSSLFASTFCCTWHRWMMEERAALSMESKETLSWLLLWAFCKGSASFWVFKTPSPVCILQKSCDTPREPAQNTKFVFLVSPLTQQSQARDSSAGGATMAMDTHGRAFLRVPMAWEVLSLCSLPRIAAWALSPEATLWGKERWWEQEKRWPQTGPCPILLLNSSCVFWHQLSAPITFHFCNNTVRLLGCQCLEELENFYAGLGFLILSINLAE